MAGICRCPSEEDSVGDEAEGEEARHESTSLPDSTPESTTPARMSEAASEATPSEAAAPKTTSTLGFVPQKRPFWNPLLPYADSLDEESNMWLSEIKSGLGRAILLQELRPAFAWEIESLKKYLKTYQKKFSKEDHIYFIKIFYAALNQPELEPSLVSQLCDILCSLLDEQKLLSPQVLQLPWKPLYETVERIAYNKFEEKGLWRHGNSKVTKNIWSVVPMARPYFPVEATREMLEEWRPWLCPFDDVVFNKAMKYLHNFLPTKLPPSAHDSGFKLWFDEMISMWLHSTGGNIYCGNGIEAYLTSLFSRLADDNVGYVDWDPYLPELFNRFFRALRLPGIPSVTPASFPVVTMSRWLIASLRPASAVAVVDAAEVGSANTSANREESTCNLVGELREDNEYENQEEVDVFDFADGNQNNSNSNDERTNATTTTTMKNLRHLFSVADSYFHPSNHGNWTGGLLQFMWTLTDHLSQRLWRERQEKPSWMTAIPPSWKLKDQDVAQFCEAILPVAWKAMYSKAESDHAALTLRHIAFWQPDKVIPKVFQKVLDDFGNLTEPHRLFATLRCAMRIGNAILHDPKLYEGDKTIFVRSLELALPGLDVNDPEKTRMTLSFFAALLPLVEPSKAGVAHLDEIMQQFVDRVLFVIENALDTSSLLIVDSSFFSLLRKKAPSTFEKIRLQIFRHVTSTFFDAEAAEIPCHLAAFLVTNLCEAAPDEGLALFMPKLCKQIIALAKDAKIIDQETPDDELFWNLNIVSPLISIGLPALENYVDDLIDIVKLAVNLRCKKLRELGCEILNELLRVLTSTYAKRIQFDSAHLAVTVGNATERDAVLSPLIGWQTPDASSIAKAQRVFEEVVFPAAETLTQLAKGDATKATTTTKEEIVTAVQIVAMGVEGAAEAMPPDVDQHAQSPIRPIESILPAFTLLRKKTRVDETLQVVFVDSDGSKRNLRTHLKEVVHRFLKEFLIVNRPDDVQTTGLVCAIFDALFFDFGKTRGANENENKVYNSSMMSMMNPISRQWLYTCESLRARLDVTHSDRLVHDVRLPLSKVDVEVVKDLIELSRSRYASIGRVAQSVLRESLGVGFSFSWIIFMEDILAPLTSEDRKKSDVDGKEFHGALATIGQTGLVSKFFWSTLRSTWLTLVTCHHDVASEKTETQNLLQSLVYVSGLGAETLDLRFTFDSSCLDLAKELWREKSTPFPSTAAPTAEEIENALRRKEENNAKNIAIYQDLVRSLTSHVKDESIRQRLRRGAMEMLSSLFRKDEPISEEITKMALELLLHPDIDTREWAMEAVISILHQLSPKADKVEMALSQVRGKEKGRLGEVGWCILKDGADMSDFTSEGAWTGTNFVDETYGGYYGWKEPVRVRRYDASKDGGAADGRPDPRQQSIESFFRDSSRVEKLVETLSLDLSGAAQKQDGLSMDKVEFWSTLCSVVGAEVISPQGHLMREAEKLISATETSRQRCLAEILVGVVRGSRDWSYSSLRQAWSWASRVIVSAVDNILVETKSDWITALIIMTKQRDPRRMKWLLNLMIDKLESCRGSNSFREANYLSALHGVLISMSWKIPCALHLVRAQVVPYLDHPYKDIRSPVANILAHVFAFNWQMPGAVDINFPKLKTFTATNLKELKILNLNIPTKEEPELDSDVDESDDNEAARNQLIERVIPLSNAADGSKNEILVDKETPDGARRRSSLYVHQQVESVLQLALRGASQTTMDLFGTVRRGSSMYDARDTNKYKMALVKCKTIMAFLIRFGSINLGGLGSEFVPLFPALCSLSGEEKSDEDLKALLGSSRRVILAARYTTSGLKHMLRMLESCAVESLWHSRLVVASSIPIFVTANLFLLYQEGEFIKGIREIVLKLLIDERLDVRQEAQKTLSTLLHFHFLTVDRSMLDNLFKLARLGTTGSEPTGDQISNATMSEIHMQKCHGGILGLCAIIQAFPYDVPRFLPGVLMELSRHVHDPNPIKTSVTAAFSDFRRTHMDNWAEDQKRFTEDQRQALVDVLVSPSYYV